MQLCNEVNAEEFYGTPLKEGRTCLLIVNGALCPRFFNRQDMESQEVRQLQVDAKALRCDFQVIDTRPVLEQLVMGIEADE